MKYGEFLLKDGGVVAFGELKEKDLPELMVVSNSVVEEGLYFHRNEGLPDLKTARRWYRDRIEAGLFFLAARVDGRLIGGASIEPGPGKASHVASLGIYLQRQFRDMGIGTRLMQKIIEIAKQKRIGMIKLTVFSTNLTALHLYKRFGFEEVGRIRNGVRFPGGTYADDIIMVLNLDAKKH